MNMENLQNTNRRHFLQSTAMAAAGISLGTAGFTGCAARNAVVPATGRLRQKPLADSSAVSFVVSTDQREASYQALKPIANDVMKAIGNKRVVIKINCGQVSPKAWLNATDPNFVRGILDFFKDQGYTRKITIGESTAASTTTMEGYANFGYLPMEKEYNVTLVDLNDGTYTTKWLLDQNKHPIAINIIDEFLDPNVYLISATRLKTHDRVVVTLSHKNIALAAPINKYKQASRTNRNEKPNMHVNGDHRSLSFNLMLIAQMGVQADLAVLDGVVAMDGEGPVRGFEFKHGVALASTDWVAADRIGTELMGVDYKTYVRYIQWCAAAGMGNDDLAKIKIIGPDYTKHIVKYQLHPKIESEYQWIREDYNVG